MEGTGPTEDLFPVIQILPTPCAVLKAGRIVLANSAFRDLYKGNGIQEIEGYKALELLPDFTPEAVRALLASPFGSSPQTVCWKVAGALPCSGIYACEMSFHPVRSGNEQLIFWLVQDCTHDVVSDEFSTIILSFDHRDFWSVVYVSPLIENWTGYPPDSFYSDKTLFFSLIHPEDRDRVSVSLKSSFERSSGFDVTYRLSHKDGSYRWVHHIASFKDAGPNNPGHFYSSLKDVTEEREGERALAEARERYSMIFQKAPLGILCIDRNGYVVDCNRQLCDLIGVSKGSFLGLNTLTTHNLILRTIARNILRGVDYEYEGPYPTDGSMGEIQVSILATPLLDSNKSLIGGLCLYQDIRKRLALEQSLRQERDFSRAVMDSTGIVVIITDINGMVLSVNPAVSDLTGFSDKDLMDRILWETLIPDKDAGSFKREFEQALLTGKSGPLETSCNTKGRGIKILSWSFAVLAGAVQGQDTVVLTGLDITSRHQLEEHLRRGQKMEAIGRLAGGVAHEFNNQLTSILGYCQILLEELDSSHPLYKRLKKIEKAAKRSAETTKQLLAFSRKQNLLLEQIDLNPVILEGVELFKQFLAENTEVLVNLSENQLIVNVDRTQIQQILLNLALNARDAMPNGGTLRVETSKVFLNGDGPNASVPLPRGSYAMLAVEDTGHGMPPEVLEKAFEPFFTTKPVGKGAGLGLAMVYGTVKQSQGHVVIHSEQAKGTRVEIYLPLLLQGAEDLDDGPLLASSEESCQILLVEDDSLTRETVASVLHKLGFGVLPAASGEEALGILKRLDNPPDAILSDVVLPGMNGRVLAERAMEMYPDLKVIFMSGYPRDILEVDGEPDIDVPLLMKPFTMEKLASTLREVLGEDHG